MEKDRDYCDGCGEPSEACGTSWIPGLCNECAAEEADRDERREAMRDY